MVETHIDISSVAGETAIDKDSITSQDGSVIVTETDNGVDLSVVQKTITSEDGSIIVTETADNVDLSVDIPIVTEEVDGLENHTDKELRDHSYTNIAMRGAFTDVDAAIKSLQSIDSQYKPQHGQAIQFTDTDGKVHLFRYFGYYNIERNGSGREWVASAYDEKNDKWCILKYTKVGDLTVATSKTDASLWTVKENILGSRERWFSLTSGDGKLVALSGNASQEYAVSEDGGESWRLYSNIESGYWRRIVFGMGKWWFAHEKGLYTTTDFSTFEDLTSRVSSFKTTDMIVGRNCTYFLDSDKKVYVYDEDEKTLSAPTTLSTENQINQVVSLEDGDVVAFGSNSGIKTGVAYSSRVMKWDGSGWTTLYQNSATTLCGMMISQDLSHVVEIHHTKLVLVDLSTKKSTDIDLPESVTNFSNFSVNGNEILVVNGQHTEGDSGSGNFAFLIDMLTGKILNSEWSEIPILSSNKNTLLASNDGEFANVNLNGHLTYSEKSKTLSTENSDRYEEYENYRLSDGEASLFVTTELSAIAIGDAVYSDEQCTTQIGTVENVHHNPNNPNDVVVKTNEDSEVYRFVGKQLDSLASSQAVANLWERVKDYSSNTFYTKTESDNLLSSKADKSAVEKSVLEITDDNKATYIQKSSDGTQYGAETFLFLDKEYDLVVFNTSTNTSISLSGIRPLGDLTEFSQGYIVTLVGGDAEGNNVRLSEAGRVHGYKYSFAEYLYAHHGGQPYAQSGQCLFFQFMHYNGTWFSKSY